VVKTQGQLGHWAAQWQVQQFCVCGPVAHAPPEVFVTHTGQCSVWPSGSMPDKGQTAYWQYVLCSFNRDSYMQLRSLLSSWHIMFAIFILRT
jgi:hypothetical protein